MGILAWIVVGLIAGALAKWIMPGKDPGGVIITMLLGIGGGVVGGIIGSALGLGGVRGFSLGTILLATAGAVLLLAIWRTLKKK